MRHTTTITAEPDAPLAGTTTGSRHRWVVLGIGVAAQASFSAAFSGIPVTGPTMQSEYHLSTHALGLVLGCIALGIAVSEVGWGVATDKYGERKILLTGLISTGLLLALMAAAVVPTSAGVPSTVLLGVALLVVGILGGSVNGSSGRAVMAWFKDGQRGFAMSIRQTAIPAGGAIGTALLPWLASTAGFRAVYAVLAAFCLVSAAATWRWMRQPPEAAATPSATAPVVPVGASARAVLGDRQVLRLAIASGLLTVPQFAILTFAAVFLHDAKGAGIGAAAATILVVQVGGAAARVWSGRYTDKHGNRRAYVKFIGVATAVAMVLAASLVHAPTVLVAAALAVGGLLANAWHGVAYTEIATMAGTERAGTALGLENTTVFAAAFLTPVLLPVLLTASSWGVVWAVAGLCTLAAVPLTPGAATKGSS